MFSITNEEIDRALEKCAVGLRKYTELLMRSSTRPLISNHEFKRRFNDFFGMGQKSADWYNEFYSLFDDVISNGDVDTTDLVERLYSHTNTYELSFCSKMAHICNRNIVIWDSVVCGHLDVHLSNYKKSLRTVSDAYDSLCREFSLLLVSDLGKVMLDRFDYFYPSHVSLTDVKKIDFILWQHRPNKCMTRSP